MGMANIIALLVSVCLLLLIFELLREERLTFKYAVGWIILVVLAILGALFDEKLFELAHFFGFELASNFVFFAVLAFFVFLSLFMTIFLCQQNKNNDIMIQKIGMLEHEVNQLKKKKDFQANGKDNNTASE